MNKAPSHTPRLPRAKKKIYSAIGGVALAVAVALGGNAVLSDTANAQTPTTTPAANPNQKPAPSTQDARQKRGGVSGTISAINGNNITLKQGDAVTIQATVNASTTYTKAGQTITLADLKVGQTVSLRQTTAADGTVTVSSVEVILNQAKGTVSAVDASSLTLTRSDNTTLKVNLTSTTTYSDLDKASTLAAIKAGMKVNVAGTTNSDGSLTAEVVRVEYDRLGGTITAISGNTITVQSDGRGGGKGNNPPPNSSTTPPATTTPTATATTKTITVSSSTVYTSAGQTIQLSDLAVGSRVNAQGTLSSDGNSITALQVTLDLPNYRGSVTSVNGSTIVIQERNTTRTIEVNSSTKYLNGTAAATLADVKAGVSISAEGKVDSSGKMTASVIQLGQSSQGGKGGKGGRH